MMRPKPFSRIELITARDQTAAEQLMRKHIRSAYHERLNLLFKG